MTLLLKMPIYRIVVSQLIESFIRVLKLILKRQAQPCSVKIYLVEANSTIVIVVVEVVLKEEVQS